MEVREAQAGPTASGAGAAGPAWSVEQRARLFDATHGLEAVGELGALLAMAGARLRALFGVAHGVIRLRDGGAPAAGLAAAPASGPALAERGITGWVLRHGIPQQVADVGLDPRWDRHADGPAAALLCAPLGAGQHAIGVVAAGRETRGGFPAGDEVLLEGFAGALAAAIDRLQQLGAARAVAARLRAELGARQAQQMRDHGFRELVAHSAAMHAVRRRLESVAALSAPLLISGESGTGKEVVARALHAHGPRRERPFVAVDCSTLGETLLGSELFGHRRHAFPGAVADRGGLLEVADGGTILLDEIGDLPLGLQGRLLRVLRAGEVLPLGAMQPRPVDVRIIAATRCDLGGAVRAGRFRDDLLAQLAASAIVLPPLRERREDLPLLVAHLLARTAARFGMTPRACSAATLACLAAHPWPGNVRELQNAIEHALVMATGAEIAPADLPASVRAGAARPLPAVADGLTLRAAREVFERAYLARALAAHGGNASQAARTLGISRVMLQRRIRAWNLRR